MKISVSKSSNNVYNHLNSLANFNIEQLLNKCGRDGVRALKEATPIDTGKTADGWYYRLVNDNKKYSLIFCNTNVNKGANIAFIIQNGHVTTNGTWTEGIDYINPALAPIYSYIKNKCSEAVFK